MGAETGFRALQAQAWWPGIAMATGGREVSPQPAVLPPGSASSCEVLTFIIPFG